MNKINSQSGSALIYIFIGIALFSALIFIISRGSNQNTSQLTEQKGKISAVSIIDYSRSLEGAVQKLISNGCSENEISFDVPPYTANPNSNAPSDKHCHVFHSNGGKLNANASGLSWTFSSNAAFPNQGTSAGELGAYLGGLDTTTCQKINDTLNNGLTVSTSFTGTIYSSTFAGTYTLSPVSLTPATNITAGCTLNNINGPAVFFKTLLIR